MTPLYACTHTSVLQADSSIVADQRMLHAYVVIHSQPQDHVVPLEFSVTANAAADGHKVRSKKLEGEV